MKTQIEARLDVLLDAICAVAASLPPDARQQAGAALGERMAGMRALDEATDAAVASDLARILGTLGCLPPVVAPNAV